MSVNGVDCRNGDTGRLSCILLYILISSSLKFGEIYDLDVSDALVAHTGSAVEETGSAGSEGDTGADKGLSVDTGHGVLIFREDRTGNR